MLIYEINLDVDEDINYKVAGWLTEHVAEMLEYKGFKIVYWFFRNAVDEGLPEGSKTLWTLHYVVEDRPCLDEQINKTPNMKQAISNQFGDKVKVTSRILNLLTASGLPFDAEGSELTSETTVK